VIAGCVETKLTFGATVGAAVDVGEAGFWDPEKVLAVGDGSGLSGLCGAPGGVSGESGESGLSGLSGAPDGVGSCRGTIRMGEGRRRWYMCILKDDCGILR
jgi:hypothetical protein